MRCRSSGSRAADHSASTPPGRSAVFEPLDAVVGVEGVVAGARQLRRPFVHVEHERQPAVAGGPLDRAGAQRLQERRQIDRVQRARADP